MGIIIAGVVVMLIDALINCWAAFIITAAVLICGIVLYYNTHVNRLEKAVKATVVGETPIVGTITVKNRNKLNKSKKAVTSMTQRNIVTGYNVKFSVEYEDGTQDIIVCEQGSRTYNMLIKKAYGKKIYA